MNARLLSSLGLLCGAMLVSTVLTSCGGSTGSMASSMPGPVLVSISPGNAALAAGQSQTFVATVTGSGNLAITWSVREGAAGGSINGMGIYTAPAFPGSYTVVATSQADNSKRATAAVGVAPLSTAITPAAAIVGPGSTTTFTAGVADPANPDITWSVVESAGGAITNAGVYTSPATLGTYHVVATSVVDASHTSTAAVSVVASGFFTPTGSMSDERGYLTATALASGKVLVAGGDGGSNPDWSSGTNLAELYDPATGSLALTGKMTSVRFRHTATRLQNGTVLVTGGKGDGGSTPLGGGGEPAPVIGSAELYDPVAGTFTATGNMVTERYAHTATLLPDGKVLIVGGRSSGTHTPDADGDDDMDMRSAETYDPDTGAFTATGSMVQGRSAHTATLLADSTVLISGGLDRDGGAVRVAELYNPAKGTFSPTGAMATARAAHSATLLPNGKVLMAGGYDSRFSLLSLLTAEVYDPALKSFSATGNLGLARAEHSATLLQNGKVLIAGGGTGPFMSTSELYDPATGTGTFTPSGTMQVGRTAHAATLLPSGRVLVVGGEYLTSAELYQ